MTSFATSYHPLLKIILLSTSFLLLCACSQPAPVTTSLSIKFGSQILDCDHAVDVNGRQWQLQQWQIYLYGFELRDEQNRWHTARPLVNQGLSDALVLLGQVCDGQLLNRLSLVSDVNSAEVTAIRFNVGVPSSLNHLNPLTQPAPLNQSDMFWSWQLGHKFMRIELQSEQRTWLFHQGAMGCRSPSPVRPPKESCDFPNVGNIELGNFRAGNHLIFRLDHLLANLDLEQISNCQSSPDTSVCETLLQRMGVEAPQQVFEVAP